MPISKDRRIVRELAKEYLGICHDPREEYKRRIWKDIHALDSDHPAILLRPFLMFHEVPELRNLACEHPVLRALESQLRSRLFLSRQGDDMVFEPFLNIGAVHENQDEPIWGIPRPRNKRPDSYHADNVYENAPIRTLQDAATLSALPHRIDDKKTAQRQQIAEDAVGDLLDINVVRAPRYAGRPACLIPDLMLLRGMTQLMMDMTDNPQWVHEVLAFMRDAVLESFEAAEEAGDWQAADSDNQAMPYSHNLADPRADLPASMGKLWGYFHAQEYTLVSPAMHDEFCLQYQRPIMKKFGRTAYGCCEDLTKKIAILGRVNNLRRIAVTPRADVAECAEQIGNRYTISWRPNPADMVCCAFNEDKIRRILSQGVRALKGCHYDITLKDVVTVENRPERLSRWVEITRDVIDKEYA